MDKDADAIIFATLLMLNGTSKGRKQKEMGHRSRKLMRQKYRSANVIPREG
jgi:hypothetical protein